MLLAASLHQHGIKQRQVLVLELTLGLILEPSLELGLWHEIELGWMCQEDGAWRKNLSNLPLESNQERKQ